ncbi:MAG: GAF domain-containing protein [Chloroflexota bacterium]
MLTLTNTLHHNIAARNRIEEKTQQSLLAAKSLVHLATRLEQPLALDAVLGIMCDETSLLMGVDVVSILLPYKQGEMLYAAPHGALPYCFARTNGTSKFFYDEVLRQIGTAIVVPNTQAFSTLLGANIYAELKIHTTVAAAILLGNELIGVLSVGVRNTARVFNETELTLLQGLANHAAQAIVNAQLFEKTQRHWSP